MSFTIQKDLFEQEHFGKAAALSEIARISSSASEHLNKTNKDLYSQFFTEKNVAKQMSCMINIAAGANIGDHGAGTGILGAHAIIDALERLQPSSLDINLTAYEIDSLLYESFADTFNVVCEFAHEKGHKAPKALLKGDFTSMAQEIVNGSHRTLDAAIINPPYQKLNQSSNLSQLMRKELVATPNLYALFMALTISMLKDNGEMVAIVPRSFTSGTYFKTFRLWLKTMGSIDWFVRYQKRSNVFRNSNVLQENVIIKFTRGVKQADRVKISICDSPDDAPIFETTVNKDLFFPETTDIFYIAGTESELLAIKSISSQPLSFDDLGIKFTTGKLEDFRQRKNLSCTKPSTSWAPIIYSHHWKRNSVDIEWPSAEHKKHDYLLLNKDTESKLIRRGNYLLIKRISANDDRTGRCNPAVLLVDSMLPSEYWAIDNHIQIVTSSDSTPLSSRFVTELAKYMSSTIVNEFFKSVSGTTQLNVTDLQQLRYPSHLMALRYGEVQ